MKARSHAFMQLALIDAMALVAGDFICLAQSAMARGSNPSPDQTIPSTKNPVMQQPGAPGPRPPATW